MDTVVQFSQIIWSIFLVLLVRITHFKLPAYPTQHCQSTEVFLLVSQLSFSNAQSPSSGAPSIELLLASLPIRFPSVTFASLTLALSQKKRWQLFLPLSLLLFRNTALQPIREIS
ncbi:hypothetical protein ACLOJK_030735 [Asimina triloba]